MIGKISKGAGFRGCINYVLGKPDAKLLVAEGVLTDSIQTITDCFQAQRMTKPHIRQPVGHISLSYASEDVSRMTDKMLVSLAKEYMQKMGIKDTQYIIARHNDQKPSISLLGTMTKSIRTFTLFSTVWITTDAPSATRTTVIGMSRSARS